MFERGIIPNFNSTWSNYKNLKPYLCALTNFISIPLGPIIRLLQTNSINRSLGNFNSTWSNYKKRKPAYTLRVVL